MLAIAFSVSTILTCRQARKAGISQDTVFNLAFIVFLSGITGARLLYVAENLTHYLRSPLEIFMLQQGGLSWFGGFACGIICGVLYLKKKKIPVNSFLDIVIPFVALAQAIGRIGCLLNGCCYGRPSELGLYFPVHQRVLIPTQLYSSILLLAIFVVLRLIQERTHKEGVVFAAYLLLYSLKRFFIEFWRADNPQVIFGLSLFQLFSIALFIIAVARLLSLRKIKG
jgi:phosphatidylglycerol:prolipoprotein diacylglycerol transferase